MNIKVAGYLTHERLQLLNKYKGIVANSEFDGYCFSDYEGNIKLKSFNAMMGGKTYFSIWNEMELIKLATRLYTIMKNPFSKGLEMTKVINN